MASPYDHGFIITKVVMESTWDPPFRNSMTKLPRPAASLWKTHSSWIFYLGKWSKVTVWKCHDSWETMALYKWTTCHGSDPPKPLAPPSFSVWHDDGGETLSSEAPLRPWMGPLAACVVDPATWVRWEAWEVPMKVIGESMERSWKFLWSMDWFKGKFTGKPHISW